MCGENANGRIRLEETTSFSNTEVTDMDSLLVNKYIYDITREIGKEISYD
jgi:hypothetical protein